MCGMLDQYGRSSGELLSECGIAPEIIHESGAHVAAAQEFAFQRVFMRATADLPAIWLETGRQYRLLSFGEFGLAMLAATTMREAIQFAIEHVTLTFTQCRFDWSDDAPAGDSGLLIVPDEADPKMNAFALERDLGAIRTMLDDMWQGRFPLDGIELTLDEDHGRELFEQTLQTTVRFGARRNVLYLPDRLLDAVLPLSDSLLSSTYARRCDQRLHPAKSTQDACVDAVCHVLSTARLTWPDIAAVAVRLGLSERSLRRHLGQAGTSFRQLQRRVRLQRAREMLQTDDLAVEQIAEELGYAEAASFSHAFRRWTGRAPLAFRRELRRPGHSD